MVGIQDMLEELGKEMKLDIDVTPMIINKKTLVPTTKFLVNYKVVPNFVLNIETIQDWEGQFGTKGMLKILKSLIRDAIIEAEMDYVRPPNPCAEIELSPVELGTCNFLEAWVGKCKNKNPCSKHKDWTCFECGRKATRSCSHTSQFVCGIPMCDIHKHSHGW